MMRWNSSSLAMNACSVSAASIRARQSSSSGEFVLGQPAAAMPVATGSRIRRTWWSSSSVGR